ncbi:hypothetical protein GCM10023317_18890 [Actinopolymorpha pittospori]
MSGVANRMLDTSRPRAGRAQTGTKTSESPVTRQVAGSAPETAQFRHPDEQIQRPPSQAVWVHSHEVGRTGRESHTRRHVVRTCVGCRLRTAKSDLLRVVLARDEATAWLVADVSGHAPGRGAHLHPTRECLGLAERRRAFTRALRARTPIDLTDLRRYVEEQDPGGTDQGTGDTTLVRNAPKTGSA